MGADEPKAGRPARRVLAIALAIGVPVAALVLLELAGPRALGLATATGAIGAMILRARAAPHGAARSAIQPFVPAVALAAVTWLLGDERFVLTTPALVSAALFATFLHSLRPGQVPAIERFARIDRARLAPDAVLSPEAVRHCRRFTVAWSAFLSANALVAAALAWLAPIAWWAAYTCFLAYVLMGGLLVAERVARVRMIRAGVSLSVPPG